MEIEWLDTLEARVRDTVARLGELKEENQSLRDRVDHLEIQLAAVSIPPTETEETEPDERIEALQARIRDLEDQIAAAETEHAETAATAKTWEIEREEVRRRVEGLVERLEGLG